MCPVMGDQTNVPITEELFLKQLDEIGVFQQNGRRAVHKPLLILLALAKFQNGYRDLLVFGEIEEELSALIRQFGTTSNAHRPRADYPFWYLKSDGFWELQNTEGLSYRKGKPEPLPESLRENRTRGGFKASLRVLLSKKPELVDHAAARILRRCFPETIRRDVRDTIGLQFSQDTVATKRDPKFREQVLRAYGHTCAICGFDGRVDGRLAGIEAAHIKWVEAGGPNDIQNGIAMCALHHKLFDLGAFTVAQSDASLTISDLLSGNSLPIKDLFERRGQKIQLPADRAIFPSDRFLSWHEVEVFRKS
jgi:putative restriction endonuclease